jgi:hypothetical protein
MYVRVQKGLLGVYRFSALVNMRIYIHIYTCMNMYESPKRTTGGVSFFCYGKYAYIFIFIHFYMYLCMYTYIYIYILHIYTYIYMYVRVQEGLQGVYRFLAMVNIYLYKCIFDSAYI